jgi:ABC-type glycerol-3-phosphate transport system substrate-binding protein
MKEKGKMKRLITLAMVLVLAFVLGLTAYSAPKQNMRVLLSEEPKDTDALVTALKDWEAATGNKVEMVVIPYDDQLIKFPAMAKNHDLPDLIATTRLHQLYPEEFMDMSKVTDISKFEPTALKIVGKDYTSNKITGLALEYTVTNMYYNKNAFKKAGLIPPTVSSPWTWEKLYENAAKLQQSGAVKYGFAADASRARYDIMMYANGGSLVERKGKTFVITVNSATNVATLKRFIQANNEIMPKAIWSGGTADNPTDYFKNGSVGIYLSGSWNYNSFFKDITSFEFGVMPTPKGTKGQAAIIGGSALAIPQSAVNKKISISFIKWLYRKENFQKYLNNDKGLSALKDVVYQPANAKASADYVVLQAEVKFVPNGFMIDESSGWRTYLDNEYRDGLKRAAAGEVTPEQALTTFANELSKKSGWAIKK